ncbi:DUF411 domain-containing protein [Microbulbifer aggregans]|uniref:DUF411 domain-containing protein n=1 Tax=Microbulbifer aggregans TaxID=1769779 RepID=UPI001CFDEBD0|nr:DUF411 domain-containing protein [Microbulbifer aggregans]
MRPFILALGAALLLLSGCGSSQDTQSATEARSTAATDSIALTTYKSATCGCCKLWVDHASQRGFLVDARDVNNLNDIKQQHQIAPEYQSCHTSVSENGYVFEGHVPAKLIRQFLQNPPAGARGLAVPAMPLGSPGMEVGDRFTPYEVLQLNNDGSHAVYASIDRPEQQH